MIKNKLSYKPTITRLICGILLAIACLLLRICIFNETSVIGFILVALFIIINVFFNLRQAAQLLIIKDKNYQLTKSNISFYKQEKKYTCSYDKFIDLLTKNDIIEFCLSYKNNVIKIGSSSEHGNFNGFYNKLYYINDKDFDTIEKLELQDIENSKKLKDLWNEISILSIDDLSPSEFNI